jgi:AraC-like DNA-binding protein
LSESIGISQNQLALQFKRLVGVLPKEMARIYRFAHILHLVDPTAAVDWARVAQDSYFYDQAHFNKEFLAFTGQTPTDYLRLRYRLQTENPEQAQSLGQMLID